MNAARFTLFITLLTLTPLHTAPPPLPIPTLGEAGTLERARHADDPVRNAAHQYLNVMYGKFPRIPFIPMLGSVAQACALTSTSENVSTALYTIALLTRALDTAALIGVAATPQPGQETAGFFSMNEGLWRGFYAFLGIMQLLRLPYHIRLIRNTDKIVRAAKRPELTSTLEDVRDTRIKNTFLRALIFWSVRIGLYILPFNIKNRATRTSLAICISRFADDLFLNTSAEQYGIEDRLISQGTRRATRRRRRSASSFDDIAEAAGPGPLARDNGDLDFDFS